MKQHMVQAYKVAEQRVTVISNWSDISRLYLDKDVSLPRTLCPGQPFLILAAGHLGRAQDVEKLKQLSLLIDCEEGISLQIVGSGPLFVSLRDWVREQRLHHTAILDFCEGTAFGHLLSIASCGFLSLDSRMLGLGVPSRTYTYLCAGLPVLAIVPAASETAAQLSDTGAGLVAADVITSISSLKALRQDPELYCRMSAAALAATEGSLSRGQAVRQYEQILFGQ
jgi:hypothetical protein